VVVLLLPSAD